MVVSTCGCENGNHVDEELRLALRLMQTGMRWTLFTPPGVKISSEVAQFNELLLLCRRRHGGSWHG